ncbi:MAG TPA: sigma 54-interacting transcriptional regulator, partial [Polyangiaceae bacterium]|nr:sigma 54-interacting transcriptional regulator [Polyangiaceae bacterium]
MQVQSPHALRVPEERTAEEGRAPLSILRPARSPGSARVHRTLVTESTAMQSVITSLTRLAPTEVTVTLIGETGTGK